LRGASSLRVSGTGLGVRFRECEVELRFDIRDFDEIHRVGIADALTPTQLVNRFLKLPRNSFGVFVDDEILA
jgi:hypothetical protein